MRKLLLFPCIVLLCYVAQAQDHLIFKHYYADSLVSYYTTEGTCHEETFLPDDNQAFTCMNDTSVKITTHVSTGVDSLENGHRLQTENDNLFIYDYDGYWSRMHKFFSLGRDTLQEVLFSQTSAYINSFTYANEGTLYLGTEDGLYNDSNQETYNVDEEYPVPLDASHVRHFNKKVFYTSNDIGFGYYSEEADSLIKYYSDSEHYLLMPYFKKDRTTGKLFIFSDNSNGYGSGYRIFEGDSISSKLSENFNSAFHDVGTDESDSTWVIYGDTEASLYKVLDDSLISFHHLMENIPDYTSLKKFEFIGDSLFLGGNDFFYMHYHGQWTNLLESYNFPSTEIKDLEIIGDTLYVLQPRNISMINLKPKDEGIITTLENRSARTAITLYPNPAESILHIDIPDNEGIRLISVYNMNGAIIKRYSNENDLDITDLSPGIYHVSLELMNGEYHSQQFIKK